MSDPFATALGVLLRAAGTQSVGYQAGTAAPITINAIRHRVSAAHDHGFAGTLRDGDTLMIAAADVALPAIGDVITIGDQVLYVLADPVLDAEELTWTVQAGPVPA